MGRLLKIIGGVIVVIIVLVIAVAIVLPLVIDPNDYKDRIVAAVEQSTGRNFTLDGDLTFHTFPTLRVSVGHAVLGNAKGFGDEPFAEIQKAALSVRLLPLLSGRIDVGKVDLQGLVLNLETNAAGKTNWQDLSGSSTAPPATPAPESSSAKSFDFNVDEIQIDNSQVKWSDAGAGTEWTLSDFNFTASDFGQNTAFPLAMNFALQGEGLKINADVKAKAKVSLADQRYRLDDFKLIVNGEGPAWPKDAGQVTLDLGTLTADLGAGTLALDGLEANAFGITTTGSLKGRNLLADLALSGSVNIQPFDPGAVLDTLGVKMETADPTVLKKASAQATFVYDSKHMGLDNMKLALDDSALTGSVALYTGNKLRFDLAVNEINADRYLPPAEEGAAASENEGSVDAIDLPVAVLKDVDVTGKLTVGKGQFSGMTLTDAAVAITAANGHMSIKPSAKLYGGTLGGDIKLDVEGDAVKLTFDQAIKGVDMLPLSRDLLGEELVSGTGNVTLDLVSMGTKIGEMRRALDGNVSFAITDGALQGIDLWYELQRAHALLNKESAPAKPKGGPETRFSSVSATGVVTDAILTTKDLNASLPFMQVDGKGTVNLLNDKIDFNLVATFVSSDALKKDPLMGDLAGHELPLTIGGTIDSPSVLPDFKAVLKQRAQAELEEKLTPERKEAQEKLDQKKQEAEDKLDKRKEELKNKLRGILDR